MSVSTMCALNVARSTIAAHSLGLSEQAPRTPTLDYGAPAFAPGGDGSELAAGPLAALVRQQYWSGSETTDSLKPRSHRVGPRDVVKC